MTSHSEKHIHQGRNIKRFREMLGIKQEAIAIELGDDWTQKKVSHLETKETIEPALLQQVAAILKVPVAALENMDDEGAINIIANTFTDNDEAIAVGNIDNYKCNFNPLDKMVELYERMIAQQAEMIEKLERLIKEK
ncbi:helix-turn-helix domain-containing protein [Taibaiella koreensis]|uniref:helix-turn-helix domain-containing protein n=1 Tax=Taibaiella koreensis TaxID=1268548 RepID=UPI000E5994F6|nr:helix-turn-helix transcriptional regulator [Taibaiella koreensis]